MCILILSSFQRELVLVVLLVCIRLFWHSRCHHGVFQSRYLIPFVLIFLWIFLYPYLSYLLYLSVGLGVEG